MFVLTGLKVSCASSAAPGLIFTIGTFPLTVPWAVITLNNISNLLHPVLFLIIFIFIFLMTNMTHTQ